MESGVYKFAEGLSNPEFEQTLSEHFARRKETIAILINPTTTCKKTLNEFFQAQKIKGYYIPEIEENLKIQNIFQNAKWHEALIMNCSGMSPNNIAKIKKEAQQRKMQILIYYSD